MSANIKWFQLAADIVSYEMQHAGDGQLLSEACDRWITAQPIAARVCIVAAGLALTAHLANLVDPNYDVISVHFWRRVRRQRLVVRQTKTKTYELELVK